MKNLFLILFLSIFCSIAKAQFPVSISTDLSLLKQFSNDQKFWAVGQTVQFNVHFSKKESLYALVCYYTNGKLNNNSTAIAKDASTNPAVINYNIQSLLRYRQISAGWKHFFKGSYNEETSFNLYGYAGFGLLLGKAENITNATIDTTVYTAKPIAGSGNFKRLTFDLSFGGEILLGGGVYFYTELRTWLPVSDYPSPYLIKDDIPSVISLNSGIRILID